MDDLKKILSELYSNTETDFEGDCTYRIHVKTAERLIKEAYKKGVDSYHDKLAFVGYTNGYQIYYAATEPDCGGNFYQNSDNDTVIPLYMLENHWHRLESTTKGEVTLDTIKKLHRGSK